MTALKVLGIVLAILLFAVSLRVGVIFHFGEEVTLKLRIGSLRVTILPKREKKTTQKKAGTAIKKKAKKRSYPKLKAAEIYDLVTSVFSGLKNMARRAGKHLYVDPLELSVIIGGSDPAEIAQSFGVANALMWSLMPRAEETFRIPDPAIHLEMDYNAPKTTVTGTVGLSFRVGNIIMLVWAVAGPLLTWLRRYKKAHANDPTPSETAKGTLQNASDNNSEKRSA